MFRTHFALSPRLTVSALALCCIISAGSATAAQDDVASAPLAPAAIDAPAPTPVASATPTTVPVIATTETVKPEQTATAPQAEPQVTETQATAIAAPTAVAPTSSTTDGAEKPTEGAQKIETPQDAAALAPAAGDKATNAAEPAPKETTGPAKPASRDASTGKADSQAADNAQDAVLVVQDVEEVKGLPATPAGPQPSTGKMTTYVVNEEDTFLDIARHFGLGYIELRAANPGIDPWAPTPGTDLIIPGFNLLPRAKQQGIVVNLGDMRMYYFRDPGKPPLTYALGVGREGLQTPTGTTTIVNKVAGPTWRPTDRMIKEKPWLPRAVPAGNANPLGTHAMYLGWPTFLIHGSNKPWGIGRRVSSGCMRMYPEDIIRMFNMTSVGTKVTVVDQPLLVGWVGDALYFEANPSKTQGNDIEINGTHADKEFSNEVRQLIIDTAGPKAADKIDWAKAEQAFHQRWGFPVRIASLKPNVNDADMKLPTVSMLEGHAIDTAPIAAAPEKTPVTKSAAKGKGSVKVTKDATPTSAPLHMNLNN